MTKVGKHYIKDRYNCANFVADWYSSRLGISIPVVNEFGRSFVVWMRKHFSPVSKPVDNCLVLMVNHDGTYHVGVYHDYGVLHNFKPGTGHGAVCKWSVGSVESYYSKVSYHIWSQ